MPLKCDLYNSWGAWVAQWVSVQLLISAQVTISGFVGSSPASGSVLSAGSLEPALDSVSPSLSAPPPLMLCPSLPKINKRWGAWVAQSVEHPTSAQVMLSWSHKGFEPRIGLCADSWEPGACFGFCVSLSLCPSPHLSKTNIKNTPSKTVNFMLCEFASVREHHRQWERQVAEGRVQRDTACARMHSL